MKSLGFTPTTVASYQSQAFQLEKQNGLGVENPCCCHRDDLQVTISGAAKVATTKKEFEELKAAQAKSDIREKFAGGLGEVDPEVGLSFSRCFFLCFFIRWRTQLSLTSVGQTPFGGSVGFFLFCVRWKSVGFRISCGEVGSAFRPLGDFPLHFSSVGIPFSFLFSFWCEAQWVFHPLEGLSLCAALPACCTVIFYLRLRRGRCLAFSFSRLEPRRAQQFYPPTPHVFSSVCPAPLSCRVAS